MIDLIMHSAVLFAALVVVVVLTPVLHLPNWIKVTAKVLAVLLFALVGGSTFLYLIGVWMVGSIP